MYTDTRTALSPTRTQSRGTSTIRCTAIRRTVCTARSNRVQIYCEQGSLAMLSADGRHWHPRQQGGERSKCLRLSLSCEASAAALRTNASLTSPLRLSGEPPDSQRGGAVTFNPSRRAGCEGTREPRQPCRELERGGRMGACGGYALLGLGLFAQSVLTRCTRF
jgi:hypothetical protein